MRHIALPLILVIVSLSCGQERKVRTHVDKPKHTAYFDTVQNTYYIHKAAFTIPDHWSWDYGVAGRKIFRAYQPDSAISFIIYSKAIKEPVNLWEAYEQEKESVKYFYKNMIPGRLETSFEDLTLKKVYIKGRKALKGKFQYQTGSVNFEYSNTCLLYQVLIDKVLYNFGLHVPTIFYNKTPEFYNRLVSNISFLSDGDEIITKQ